jgi:hypothetical protein
VKVILAACLLAAIAAPAGADPVQWPTNGHWYEAVPAASYTWEQADQAARIRRTDECERAFYDIRDRFTEDLPGGF